MKRKKKFKIKNVLLLFSLIVFIFIIITNYEKRNSVLEESCVQQKD